MRNGIVYATPATAEKGKLDARIEVFTPGGHSSVPPQHTVIPLPPPSPYLPADTYLFVPQSIGILASLITALESYPHPTTIHRGSTYYQSLQCTAQHDPNISPTERQLIKESVSSDEALRQLEEYMPSKHYLYGANAGTTQAVDMVGGGVKANALPESAWAIVNHRIAEYRFVFPTLLLYVVCFVNVDLWLAR
jgi:Gly-Xaa carboxypeptidase